MYLAVPLRQKPREVSPARLFATFKTFCLIQKERSACGPQVDLAFRERGQLGVSLLFLIQRLLENAGAVIASELPRPRDQAAVAGDLIVLGGLRSVDGAASSTALSAISPATSSASS